MKWNEIDDLREKKKWCMHHHCSKHSAIRHNIIHRKMLLWLCSLLCSKACLPDRLTPIHQVLLCRMLYWAVSPCSQCVINVQEFHWEKLNVIDHFSRKRNVINMLSKSNNASLWNLAPECDRTIIPRRSCGDVVAKDSFWTMCIFTRLWGLRRASSKNTCRFAAIKPCSLIVVEVVNWYV